MKSMTVELVAEYLYKRKKKLKFNLMNCLQMDSEVLLKEEKLVTEEDIRVIDIINNMSYDDVNKADALLREMHYEDRRKKAEQRRKSYEKRQDKLEENGKKFKDEIEVGNVVEVTRAGGSTGFMYVMDKMDETFLGQYVYRKLDMEHNMYKRTPNSVTEKMYKFVKRIVQKEITLLS